MKDYIGQIAIQPNNHYQRVRKKSSSKRRAYNKYYLNLWMKTKKSRLEKKAYKNILYSSDE